MSRVSEDQLRFEETMRSKSPRKILASVRRLLPKYRQKQVPNWVLAMEVYGVGSTYGFWICREHGIDPDTYTLTAFDQPIPSKAQPETPA